MIRIQRSTFFCRNWIFFPILHESTYKYNETHDFPYGPSKLAILSFGFGKLMFCEVVVIISKRQCLSMTSCTPMMKIFPYFARISNIAQICVGFSYIPSLSFPCCSHKMIEVNRCTSNWSAFSFAFSMVHFKKDPWPAVFHAPQSSFDDIVHSNDEEIIVTYVDFVCGFTIYPEAPTEVDHINPERKNISRSCEKPICFPTNDYNHQLFYRVRAYHHKLSEEPIHYIAQKSSRSYDIQQHYW